MGYNCAKRRQITNYRKTGTLRIIDRDNKLSQPITGLPEVNSNGQGGLLDIVADPEFDQNRLLYWVFSERKDGKNATVVAKEDSPMMRKQLKMHRLFTGRNQLMMVYYIMAAELYLIKTEICL